MDSLITSVFVILQLILAPILYPYGYLLEFAAILFSSYQYRYLREIELQLLEPLILVFLLTNMTLCSEPLSATGYAVRIMLVMTMCFHSQRLQELSNRMITPTMSCLLLIELLAVKQLYPFGYLAQLLLIYFLYLNDCSNYLQKRSIKPQRSSIFAQSNPLRRNDLINDGKEPPPRIQSSSFFSTCIGLENMEETLVCKICFERFIDTTFSSCGHCCCKDCAQSLPEISCTQGSNRGKSKCPFCQTVISNKIDLFFP